MLVTITRSMSGFVHHTSFFYLGPNGSLSEPVVELLPVDLHDTCVLFSCGIIHSHLCPYSTLCEPVIELLSVNLRHFKHSLQKIVGLAYGYTCTGSSWFPTAQNAFRVHVLWYSGIWVRHVRVSNCVCMHVNVCVLVSMCIYRHTYMHKYIHAYKHTSVVAWAAWNCEHALGHFFQTFMPVWVDKKDQMKMHAYSKNAARGIPSPTHNTCWLICWVTRKHCAIMYECMHITLSTFR